MLLPKPSRWSISRGIGAQVAERLQPRGILEGRGSDERREMQTKHSLEALGSKERRGMITTPRLLPSELDLARNKRRKVLTELALADKLKHGRSEIMKDPAVAPGAFVLGSMQSSRIQAFERRQATKTEEGKKDDLKRVGAGRPTQQAPKERAKLR